MKPVRIIKRTDISGKISYVVQKRSKWLRKWEDCTRKVWMHGSLYPYRQRETYDTVQEALDRVCFHDGSKQKEEVVHSNEDKS